MIWAALWKSKNRLDGVTRYIIYKDCKPVLFMTRKEARGWINKNYGYIKTRKDLRAEPHGWRLPEAIKVKISPL